MHCLVSTLPDDVFTLSPLFSIFQSLTQTGSVFCPENAFLHWFFLKYLLLSWSQALDLANIQIYRQLQTWWELSVKPWHGVSDAGDLLQLFINACLSQPHREAAHKHHTGPSDRYYFYKPPQGLAHKRGPQSSAWASPAGNERLNSVTRD